METSTISPSNVRIKNNFSIENILSKPDKFVQDFVGSNNTTVSGVELISHNENSNFTTQFSHMNKNDTELEVNNIRRHNCVSEANSEQGSDLCAINIKNGFTTPDSSCDDIADTCSDVASEESNCECSFNLYLK